jgi:hypothetical protein
MSVGLIHLTKWLLSSAGAACFTGVKNTLIAKYRTEINQRTDNKMVTSSSGKLSLHFSENQN